MARKRKSTNNRTPFIMFTYKMMNSRAYKALGGFSAKSLPFFLAKVKLPVTNDQRYREIFTLPYGELMAAAGIGSAETCSKVFQDLVRTGFISPVKKGGLRGHGKSSSEYKLSRRWQDYDQPGFLEIDLKRFAA